jgi:hypothetical protein
MADTCNGKVVWLRNRVALLVDFELVNELFFGGGGRLNFCGCGRLQDWLL